MRVIHNIEQACEYIVLTVAATLPVWAPIADYLSRL